MIAAVADAGISEAFLSDVTYACERTRHPISIMLPVLWADVYSSDSPSVPYTADLAYPESPAIRGVPAYAYDKHTYAGKAAIGRFAVENSQVAAVLNRWVPDFRARDAAAMAAFYVDAIPVRPQFVWQNSIQLEALGREADFLKIGFPVEGIDELVAAVRGNLDHLNQLRTERVLRQSRKSDDSKGSTYDA